MNRAVSIKYRPISDCESLSKQIYMEIYISIYLYTICIQMMNQYDAH